MVQGGGAARSGAATGDARKLRCAPLKLGAVRMKVRSLPATAPLKRYQSMPSESARIRSSKASAGLKNLTAGTDGKGAAVRSTRLGAVSFGSYRSRRKTVVES